MPMFIFARFEPEPGKESELRGELLAMMEPTRAEPGCIRVNVYESAREPIVFFIHSVFESEAAFEAHAELPHTVRFLEVIQSLMTHPLQAMRTSQIG